MSAELHLLEGVINDALPTKLHQQSGSKLQFIDIHLNNFHTALRLEIINWLNKFWLTRLHNNNIRR